MSSHKARLKAQNSRGSSVPRLRSYPSHQDSRHGTHDNKRHSEYNLDDEESQNPVYVNLPHGTKENGDRHHRRPKSMERMTDLQQSFSRLSLGKSQNTGLTYGSKPYMTMNGGAKVIHKSQSMNALKASEPNKQLSKSSIQQEYHDKMVQHYLSGLSYGRARRPCQIATAMIVMFVLFFTVGLLLICLTYIYKNINFSLDKGEVIGPIILAGSFIFFGVGVKYLYDAHRISRLERKTIRYVGTDTRYVGLKSKHIPNGKREHLVSGQTTTQGLSRVPNQSHMPRGTTLNSQYQHRQQADLTGYNLDDEDSNDDRSQQPFNNNNSRHHVRLPQSPQSQQSKDEDGYEMEKHVLRSPPVRSDDDSMV